MRKHQKTWTIEEKLEIVNYYKQHGMAKAVREYSVSNVSIYKWERVLEETGEGGLRPKNINSTHSDIRKLQRENERLMRLVAEKEVIISIQKDLLKKRK